MRISISTTHAVLCVVCMMAIAGCAALPLPVNINIREQADVEGGTALEGMLGGFQFSRFAALDVTQSQEFQNTGASRQHIQRASVSVLALTVLSPANQDFNFIEEIAFFAEAPGQPRQRIARKVVPRGVRHFDLDLDGIDLTPYVKAESMRITTEVKGRRPASDTRLQVHMGLSMGVALF